MKALLNIGPDGGAVAAVKESADAICRILEAGHEFRHEQETVVRALEAFSRMSTISNVSVSGCDFRSDTHTHEEDDTE
jgi:hypothetical protein